MRQSERDQAVSIRYTLTLGDGTLLSHHPGGSLLDYRRDQHEVLPVLEKALEGATRGDTRRLVLSPELDPDLRLVATRLALLLGHPGETLILTAEVL